jgi:hypothetical protein
MDDAGVFPRREVRLQAESAREQGIDPASVEGGQPIADRASGLFGDLELHRPTGSSSESLSLDREPATGAHVIDPHPNETAAPELAGDGEIEHGKIALAALQ